MFPPYKNWSMNLKANELPGLHMVEHYSHKDTHREKAP